MFAIVEIAGQQFEVEPNKTMSVPHLAGEPGEKVEFTNILFANDGSSNKVGAPYIEGKVNAEIIEHQKDKKVIVFKKKRRKGYRRLRGHRQQYTKIMITEIHLQ